MVLSSKAEFLVTGRSIHPNNLLIVTIIGGKISLPCWRGWIANPYPRYIWRYLFDPFVLKNCRSLSELWSRARQMKLSSSTKLSKHRIRSF